MSITGAVLDTLEALFLIVRIPAWSPNLSQREIRAPKVYLTDPGLAGYLRRAEVATLLRPELARGADGPIIEGFALTELLRQASSAPDPPELAHYRDRDAAEIDIVVEGPDGRGATIEVKASPGAAPAAVRNLISLRDRLGDRIISLPAGGGGRRRQTRQAAGRESGATPCRERLGGATGGAS